MLAEVYIGEIITVTGYSGLVNLVNLEEVQQ